MPVNKDTTFKVLVASIVLVIASFLLFFNLGHYALWDDEADTALYAQAVWKTGDSSSLAGKNFVAQTWELDDKLRNRHMPPIQFYLAAPFVGIWGNSSFAARFPFACCGLITIVLVFLWLHKANASKRLWILIAMGVLGNASLFLYFRQCRYFAPTILSSALLVYFYTFRKNTIRSHLSIILGAILLLFSNYLCAVAVYSCLIFDYLIWERHSRPFKKEHLLFISSIIIICTGWFFLRYYESRLRVFLFISGRFFENPHVYQNIAILLKKRSFLFFRCLRELNTYEFGSGFLLLLTPRLYFKNKDKLLLRCPAALIVYCFVVSVFSPQVFNPNQFPIAEGRYLVPLILLCILTVSLCIDALLPRSKKAILVLAVLAFYTNVLNGGTAIRGELYDSKKINFRSTIIAYAKELIRPVSQSTLIVSQWVNENIPPGSSILVSPGYQTTPLMFHVPQMRYGWHLNKNELYSLKNKLKSFRGPSGERYSLRAKSPEYMIAYGHHRINVLRLIEQLKQRGIDYTQIEQINVFWMDLTRPELFWRTFKEVMSFNIQFQSIYIYKKDLQEHLSRENAEEL